MANQVQGTILNVNGSALSPSQSISFAINSIWLQQSDKHGANTVICDIVGGAKYYASEEIGSLVATGLVQVTVIQKDNARQEESVQMAFPANQISLKESSLVSGAITVVTFNGSVYYVSESEESLVSAANAGGGGGVESVVAGDGISVDDTDPANPVVSASGGGLLQSATVTLTDAQIKALPTTPITIVAAPGAGKIIVPVSGIVVTNSTAGAYTNVDSFVYVFNLMLTGANTAFLGGFMSEILPNPGDITYSLLAAYSQPDGNDPPIQLVTPVDAGVVSPPVNKALITGGLNGSGNFTGGNAANSMKITVYYVIVDV